MSQQRNLTRPQFRPVLVNFRLLQRCSPTQVSHRGLVQTSWFVLPPGHLNSSFQPPNDLALTGFFALPPLSRMSWGHSECYVSVD